MDKRDRGIAVVGKREMANEGYEAVLGRHGLEIRRSFGGIVCARSDCGGVVGLDRRSVRKHMNADAHEGVNGEEFEKLFAAVREYAGTIADGDPRHALYRTGGWGVGVLPRVEGLPVVNARKCPKCDVMFAGESTLKKHHGRKHGSILGRRVIRGMPVYSCQGLTKKKGEEKLYRVQERMDGNEEDRERVVLQYDPMGGTLDMPGERRGLSTDRRMGGFVSVARCDERLELFGLNGADAIELTSLGDTETGGSLSELVGPVQNAIRRNMERAREGSHTVGTFYSTMLAIAVPGTKDKRTAFKFLEEGVSGNNTMKRYGSSGAIVVMAACRVYQGGPEKYCGVVMSEELKNCARGVLECDKDDTETLCKVVHDLLYCVFSESSDAASGTKKLFASCIAACICVGKFPGDRIGFRSGLNVRPIIAGLSYVASCTAYLEIREYGSSDKIAEVRKMMEPNGMSGVTVFCELRSLCVLVAEEETPLHLYEECLKHENCGKVNGIECSTGMVGMAVKAGHRKLRSIIEDELLGKNVIPSELDVENVLLWDDIGDNSPGYWALGDVRNKVFVSQCLAWVARIVVPMISGAEEAQAWVTHCKDAVELMLTVMHLAGGAPGRGTEIGAVGIRNTAKCRRGLFFSSSDEVMIIPTYNKTRAMRRGKIRFLSRHLDEETTKLVKMFFLLVHPVVVSVLESRWVGDVSDVNLEDLRDVLGLGFVKDRLVSRKVGSWMAELKLPFGFSTYRHWQRGFVKSKASRSELYRLLDGEIDHLEDEENPDFSSIVQAGHSVRTARAAYGQRKSVLDYSLTSESNAIALFRLASQEWHRDVGLRNLEDVRVMVNDGREGNGSERTRCSTNEIVGRISQVDMKAIAEEVVKAIARRDVGKDVDTEEVDGNEGYEFVECRSAGSLDVGVHGYVRFDAEEALSRCTGVSGARFRSSEQRKAMDLIWEKRSDVIVVLAVGMGKTAVVCGPVFYEEGVTIWVSPLRALRDEMKDRFRGMNMKCFGKQDLERTFTGCGNVILLGPEEIARTDVQRGLCGLDEKKLVNRVVIDEGHLPLISEGFRECMVSLQVLGDMRSSCQRVVLSGTIPAVMVRAVMDMYGMTEERTVVIRGNPMRKNLALDVHKVVLGKEEDLLNRANVLIRVGCLRVQKQGSGEGRVLVACLTIAHVRRLARKLIEHLKSDFEVCVYHSKLSDEERDRNVSKWKSVERSTGKGTGEKICVMLATEGFCTGTDASDIRLVFVVGGCRSLLDFWQTCGRGGRDGKYAKVTVLYDEAVFRKITIVDCAEGERNVEWCGSFKSWVDNDTCCRREALTRFLGWTGPVITCAEEGKEGELENVALCDVCEGRKSSMEDRRRGVSVEEAYRVVEDIWNTESCVRGKRIREDPSEEAKTVKERRVESYRSVPEQRREGLKEFVRRIGKKLRRACIACVLGHSEGGVTDVALVRKFALRCAPSRCYFLKKVCLRCMREGHRASECPVLESVLRGGETRCRECFMTTVRGRPLHEGEEFGRKYVCPYGVCTKLVIACFGLPEYADVFGSVEKEFGVDFPVDAGLFAKLLQTDRIGLGSPYLSLCAKLMRKMKLDEW